MRDLPRYITTADAAEMLSVTGDKILDLISSGQLPAINVALRVGGKARWRIAVSDLEEFVRVKPGEDWRLETGIFEDKQNREIYLVEPALWPELMSEIFPACLFYTVTRQSDVMLWPVRLPGPDGKTNSWNESALAAA